MFFKYITFSRDSNMILIMLLTVKYLQSVNSHYTVEKKLKQGLKGSLFDYLCARLQEYKK